MQPGSTNVERPGAGLPQRAAVYATDGDTLKSEHLFFDQMDFLGQLGLLPG